MVMNKVKNKNSTLEQRDEAKFSHECASKILLRITP
jgi:hypothetical protein